MNAPVSKERLAGASVLVVGDVMLDRYWFGDVERISPEAPVPIVHVTREEYRPGGAANVALNIASLGARATLLSVVGEDDAAATLAGLLRDAGVETAFKTDAALSTTVKLRVSGRAQQLLRVDFESRPAGEILRGMTEQFRDLAAGCDAILLSDYGKGGLGHVREMIAHARMLGRPVLVDPKGRDYAPYAGATMATPNRAELAQVVGAWEDEADLEARAEALRRSLALEALLVTRSEEGMSLFDCEGHLRILSEQREVFDVTGAGDTVIATLATLVAAGLSPRAAVPIANRAAGIVVRKFGTAAIGYEELFG
jgi:rfaE bifunctional protein kinase chain/domain